MDGIQSYRSQPPSQNGPRAAAGPLAMPTNVVKTPSDYIRALRRRVWMVLAIAVPLAIAGSIYVLRMPPVYMVKAEIEIRAPQYDQALSALVSQEIGRGSTNDERYAANQAYQIKKRALADSVVANPAIAAELTQYSDPAFELFKTLTVTPLQKNSDVFIVTLEGTDAARTAKLLEILLNNFKEQAVTKTSNKLEGSKGFAKSNVKALKDQLVDIDKRISESILANPTIGPGGRNIIEDQYLNFGSMIATKKMRMAELGQQMMIMEQFPKFDLDPKAGAMAGKRERLELEVEKLTSILEHQKEVSRNFNTEPAAKIAASRLAKILDKIDELDATAPQARSTGSAEIIAEQTRRELEADRDQQEKLLADLQRSMPSHQQFLTLMSDRAEKAKAVAEATQKLSNFEILADSLTSENFIEFSGRVAEPSVPTKPNRPLLIVATLILSLGLGIALVCGLEHIDNSVKVPEHVTSGLTLPLLGVVPRIRRSALTQRGSHLWTPGTPDSLEADAYRNVRASLLGVADRVGSIVTLLVTSAKAGEGKSTTALNLAATCARAGERTLLLDIDLRRPSLADVFIDESLDEDGGPGLVDVLSGKIAWQSTLRHTDISNLDFIPTGDTRTIPIEILGTLELHQLLVALSHHYDRVILDGPAVLGLADCRFLGRLVDASVLVVRSGSHLLSTLHRAKAMLEQSHVAIAGVVFNGLTEDMSNWSSYGYEPMAFAPVPLNEGRRGSRRADELDADAVEDEAYALAGSADLQ